ncbi:hypothetical protein M0802_000129 [Mischocyttarus mexicanus]|nr:hypothetical protein M0802_000129 [Mischocyttarus mexicanus]
MMTVLVLVLAVVVVVVVVVSSSKGCGAVEEEEGGCSGGGGGGGDHSGGGGWAREKEPPILGDGDGGGGMVMVVVGSLYRDSRPAAQLLISLATHQSLVHDHRLVKSRASISAQPGYPTSKAISELDETEKEHVVSYIRMDVE